MARKAAPTQPPANPNEQPVQYPDAAIKAHVAKFPADYPMVRGLISPLGWHEVLLPHKDGTVTVVKRSAMTYEDARSEAERLGDLLGMKRELPKSTILPPRSSYGFAQEPAPRPSSQERQERPAWSAVRSDSAAFELVKACTPDTPLKEFAALLLAALPYTGYKPVGRKLYEWAKALGIQPAPNAFTEVDEDHVRCNYVPASAALPVAKTEPKVDAKKVTEAVEKAVAESKAHEKKRLALKEASAKARKTPSSAPAAPAPAPKKRGRPAKAK